MLRISPVDMLDEVAMLRLEGQVKGPWVEALRTSCEHMLARGKGLILDLSGVSFLDMEGVALCRHLRAQNVALVHCSPFVAEQLKG